MKIGAATASCRDLRMPRSVIDQAEPLGQKTGDHRDEGIAHRFGQVDVVVERTEEHVERLEEGHVAELVEAGGLARSVEQLVTNNRRHRLPITSVRSVRVRHRPCRMPSSTSNRERTETNFRPREARSHEAAGARGFLDAVRSVGTLGPR